MCSYGTWALQPDYLVTAPAMIGPAVTEQPTLDGEGNYRYVRGGEMYAPRLAVGGKAVLLLSIDAAGKIEDVEVEDVKPTGALDKAMAKSMFGNTRFSPKYADGRAVPSRVRMPMAFGPAPPALSGERVLTYSGNVSARLAPGARDAVVDTPVEIKEAPPPAYPAEALSRKQDGKVVLIVDVSADGSVAKAQIDTSHPPTVFDAAALEAVKKWKFTPAMEQGNAVPGRVQIPVTFEADRKADGATTGAGSGKQYAWYRDAGEIREIACDVMRVGQDDTTGQITRSECGITAVTDGK
jgi:TonB family protein